MNREMTLAKWQYLLARGLIDQELEPEHGNG